MAQRGNIDLDQIQGQLLTGTASGTQLVTAGTGAAVPGTVPVWGSNGNLIGISSPLGGVLPFLAGDYTILASDAGRLIWFNSSSASTVTLPTGALPGIWTVSVANVGSAPLIITPPPGTTFNGSTSSITLPSGGMTIFTDGRGNFYGATGSAIVTDTHSELLTDGDGNLILANGDVIYVVGVPN